MVWFLGCCYCFFVLRFFFFSSLMPNCSSTIWRKKKNTNFEIYYIAITVKALLFLFVLFLTALSHCNMDGVGTDVGQSTLLSYKLRGSSDMSHLSGGRLRKMSCRRCTSSNRSSALLLNCLKSIPDATLYQRVLQGELFLMGSHSNLI